MLSSVSPPHICHTNTRAPPPPLRTHPCTRCAARRAAPRRAPCARRPTRRRRRGGGGRRSAAARRRRTLPARAPRLCLLRVLGGVGCEGWGYATSMGCRWRSSSMRQRSGSSSTKRRRAAAIVLSRCIPAAPTHTAPLISQLLRPPFLPASSWEPSTAKVPGPLRFSLSAAGLGAMAVVPETT